MENKKSQPSESSLGKMESEDKLLPIYKELSQEEQQDKDSVDPQKSFLEQVDPELFVEREREYRDIEKHWIRLKVWLKEAKILAEETKKRYNRGIRYFTLPAYYRLDVSLLLREKLLDVVERLPDDSTQKVYVASFEAEPTKYARMVGHLPEFHLFGDVLVEEALTDTANQYYDHLLRLFPFDIINLDLTTSLTPKHEGPYSKTMKAIDAVFKRQAEYGSKWALFLTFRNMPEEWEDGTLDQLFENLQKNVDTYPKVGEAFDRCYHETRVRKLFQERPQECISQAVAKWLTDRANYNNLHLESLRCYFYQRRPLGLQPYYIHKQIMTFSKGEVFRGIVPTKGTPAQSWMIEDLIACIEKHKCHDVEEAILKTLENRPSFEDELKNDIDELCKMIE